MALFTIADMTGQQFEVIDRIVAQNGKHALEIFKQRLSGVVPYEIKQVNSLWMMTNPYGSRFVALKRNPTK